MKTSALIIAGCVASASAFAPSQQPSGSTTQLSAEKKSFFKTVFDMDLFAPKADQNDYGARSKKTLTRGEITGKSYIPAGLTAEQYKKIRAAEDKKKADNYQRNVKKAGVFEDYTEFYKKRGTDVGESWFKSPTRGHRMAKTKYDWSGDSDKPLWAKKK
eukprot:CAMPEP_0203663896 /NCGR_PEP_ID=MMETSP0090-20130426/1396_1 /ASSEMBLY_ACC=CAM_ASM_001088 /TAXON_ID=426623 /ORGANISM="Chaetoceros affinis, Strain CCMP159" /LENGTH=158 /DNA_ID=CAMNT_0050526941 /DNA_START=62 /DNA_END=538 /DNA_ORIENTATION=+